MKRVFLCLMLLTQVVGANAAWPPANSQIITGGYYTSVAGTFPICLTDATGVDCINKSAQFYAPLTSSLIPAWSSGNGTPTFTRATTAAVFDQDGVIRTVLAGEARFTGARRVRNLLTATEDFNNAAWLTTVNGAATLTKTVGIAGPDGSLSAARLQIALNGGSFSILRQSLGLNANARHSLWIKSNTASNQHVTLSFVAGASGIVTVTPTWQRLSVLVNAASDTFDVGCTANSDSTADILIWHPQFEDVTGQSNQNPAEYVSNGVLAFPYHGAGVDGVQYFDYLNGNTVTSNAVTAGVGASINSATLKGYLSEGAATNYFLNSSAPATQTISLGTGTYTMWLTGTGSVAIAAGTATITGAGTATSAAPLTFTVTVAGTVTATVTGTVATAQLENSPFPTSYIATAGVAVTRNGDVLIYPVGNISNTAGTAYAEFSKSPVITGIGIALGSGSGIAGQLLSIATATALTAFDGTNNPTLNTGPFVAGITYKVAESWGGATFAGTSNGAIPGMGIFNGNLGFTTNIGILSYGGSTTYGNIRNVRIWQTQLPNTTLQAITR